MNKRDLAGIAAPGNFAVLASALALVASLSVATLSVGLAKDNDIELVVKEPQTLEQAIQDELESTRFARQIAAYNGIATLDSVLPVGTTIQIPKPYLSSEEFGEVLFAKGDVTHAQENLIVNPPARGARIFTGDTFTTGADGFASLSFSSGATVNLQPESRVAVTNLDCADDTTRCVISLNATAGEVHSQITPRPDGKPPVVFSVETPFMSAAVRGTAFYVDVDGPQNRLGVTEGIVAAATNGADTDLPEGKGLVASEGADPVVVDLLAAPALVTGSEGIVLSAEDAISWGSIEGAARYRVIVATDASLQQPIATLEVDNNNLPIERSGIELGDTQSNDLPPYYLSVAAIGSDEFVGLAAVQEIQFASIEEVGALELEIERRGNMVTIATPEYDQPVELVVSKSVDGAATSRKVWDNLSTGIQLEFDPAETWVFRSRKVLGDTAVSPYSRYYVLEAAR